MGPPVLISLAVNPANASIALGTTQQYHVTGTYSDGSRQDVTTAVEWSCSPCGGVYLGSSGLVSSVAQGTATIQSALGAISGSAILTVTPATLTSLTIAPTSLTFDVGGTQQLSASGMYSNYSATDLTASSTWVSSNPTIATVSATGFVTAFANGSATITATSGTVSGTATLTVGTSTGSVLNTSRYGQSATLLNSGMVLLAGGINCPTRTSCSYLASAELYNPDAATSSNTSSLATARSAPAVLLPNGNVLLAGGYSCDSSGNCTSLRSAEIFNMPYSYGYFTGGGNMTVARSGHTVTLLNNGQVLIAGGQNCNSVTSCTALNTAEIYDPVTGTFTPTGNLNAARFNAVAVALNQGLVLIAGGLDGSNYPAAAELYDPSTGTFTSTASLNTPRPNATATVLNTGEVLISGGSTCATPGCPVSSAELYNPVAGTFANTGALSVPRFNHSATLLTNGQVLVAGGYSSCTATCTSETTAELFDPSAGTFSSTQALSTARSGQTATLVPSGDVVIAGGTSAGATLASIDFYQPSALTPPGLTSITVTPANQSIPGNMAQQFVALGTFSGGATQTLRSAVWTSSNQTVTGITNDSSGVGYVYSVSSGSTVITAGAGSVNGSTLLNTAPSLTYLNITPGSPTVLAGQTQQFSVTGSYSDGSTRNLTAAVTWSSSNRQVATLSSTTSGLASTVGAGNATIVATFAGVTANASLTVDPAMPTISSLFATSGPVGAAVSIGGSNLGDTQGSGFVTFNSVPAQVFSWNRVSIVAYVPAGASSGPVQVTAGGVASNTINFTVTQPVPTIAGISELTGAIGDTITITGSGFGTSGTVSFNGVAGSTGSWSNNSIVTQVPPGAQTGAVIVSSGGQISNNVTFTIVAAPSLTAVSPGSGDVGTVVTISGSNFTNPSNDPVVLFNGSAVLPTNWTSSQIVATVPKGTTTGLLTVKVGRLSSNGTTFMIVPAGSQSLAISPANSAVFVGQTVNLSLSDDLEHNITGADWSLSDNTLAQLSTANPPVLTATKIGTETVTATYNGLSATATVTIVAGGTAMPLGTVVCSLPSNTNAFTVLKIMQAVPSNGTTPDLIAVEDDGAGSIWLRGLTSGCSQQWHTRVGSSGGSGADEVTAETPDNFGGVIVSVTNSLSSQTNLRTASLIRVDGVSGGVSWRYDSPGNFATDIAVDQNGYVLVTENYYLDQYQQGYTASDLIKIDPNSGAPVANWHWPSSTITTVPGCELTAGTATLAPGSGPISVGPDGSYYLTISWSNTIIWEVPSLDTRFYCDDMTSTSSVTTTSQLMTISPSGVASSTTLPNPANGTVIPDGNGGALVQNFVPANQNQSQVSTQVIDAGGSNPTATISNFAGGDTVLGDQGTYFITDGNQVVCVDEASGNEQWRWRSNSGTAEIIAATAGGGVAVKNIVGNQEDVVRLDSTGTPTFDTWGTSGGSAGYGVLSYSTYWANGVWFGVGGDPVPEGVVGEPLGDAGGPYPFAGGNGPGQHASETPTVVNFLPSLIENQILNIPNAGAPNTPTTADFPCYMDSSIRNSSLLQYSNKCTVPSGPAGQIARVNAQYVLRQAATVQGFRAAFNQKLNAIAFIGHGIGVHLDQPNEFSYGINFYYPLAPGKNPGDESSWDTLYPPPNGILVKPQALPSECKPPNNTCDPKLPPTEETNALLPMEKDSSTVQGLGQQWNYTNDYFTTATTPGPPHAPLLLVNKMFPDANIFFIGACAVNPTLAKPGEVPVFLQMWDIHDSRFDMPEKRRRAIIAPLGNQTDLVSAAAVWRRVLFDMTVYGDTIQDAVTDANIAVKASNPNAQQYAIYGNSKLKF